VRGVIVVFAKAPVPGRVKTRLSPPLSPEGAAELYACMLDDVLEATEQAAAEAGLEPVLAVHPPRERGALAQRAPARFRVIDQRGADLSARMTRALAEAAAGGARAILLRGSDSPTLDPALLVAAARALESADLVACPDLDGGYSVIGVRRPVPGLFDHPMSHDRVLEQTLAAAARAGLRTRLLEPCFDLDTAADLVRLAERRSHPGSLACPRTLAWLDRHRAWPAAMA